MRLTLRTLLAYLDDTLEPTQAKQIGQKVAESEMAQKVIERIKQVTRRRRLMVPPATGPGAKIDPNTVAEYLDNALPADKLGEVEEICLESDVHLAEIAACHQILTLVLGEPTKVPPPARQRMYGLVKGREAIPFRKPAVTPAPERVARPVRTLPEETDESLLLGLPAVGRQGAWLFLLAPLLGVCALLVGLAVIIWIAMPRTQPGRYALNPAAGTDKAATTRVVEPTTRVNTERSAPDKVRTDTPPDKVPVEKEPDKVVKPTAPEKPAVAIDQAPPADKPSAERREIARYLAPSSGLRSVLLQRQPDANKWQRLMHEKDRVSTTDYLVSLPGYRSELRLNNGLGLTLWGNLPELSEFPVFESAAVLHVPPQGIDLDFTMHRGRVVVANNRPQGDANVRIRFQEEIWNLTLDNNAEAAVECWSRYPPGVPFNKRGGGEKPESFVGLFVKGQAQLRSRYQEFRMPNPGLYVWQSYRGSTANDPIGLDVLPPWWTGKFAGKPQQVRDVQVALDELNSQLRKDSLVDVVLTQAWKKSQSPTTRALAVYCLGATDDLPNLVDALNDNRREVRETAVLGLRHWISQGEENDMKLYQLLYNKEGVPSKGYTETEAEIIMQLLHSFSEEDRSNPLTYEALIAYLLHPKPAIRELSHWHLARLVPEVNKDISYDAAGDEAQRRKAFDAWKKKIPDGQLPPPRS